MKEKPPQKHSREGWNFRKVNTIINQVDDIFKKANLTFVEEQVVISWFQANLSYQMGLVSAKDYTTSDQFFHSIMQNAEKMATQTPMRGNYIA